MVVPLLHIQINARQSSFDSELANPSVVTSGQSVNLIKTTVLSPLFSSDISQ